MLYSEYDKTKQIFANTWPWLFPGGVGDLYNTECGDIALTVKQWARYLFYYEDEQFARGQMSTLFTYNTTMCHSNNTSGKHSINSGKFMGKKPYT